MEGELRAGRAWSTMKVPVVAASIHAGRVDWMRSMRRSDDARARARSARLELVRADGLVARGRGPYEVIQVGITDGTVIALAATAPDFEAAKELASKHVPQHPNTPQLRASRD